jgi:hypothetical protein
VPLVEVLPVVSVTSVAFVTSLLSVISVPVVIAVVSVISVLFEITLLTVAEGEVVVALSGRTGWQATKRTTNRIKRETRQRFINNLLCGWVMTIESGSAPSPVAAKS